MPGHLLSASVATPPDILNCHLDLPVVRKSLRVASCPSFRPFSTQQPEKPLLKRNSDHAQGPPGASCGTGNFTPRVTDPHCGALPALQPPLPGSALGLRPGTGSLPIAHRSPAPPASGPRPQHRLCQGPGPSFPAGPCSVFGAWLKHLKGALLLQL